MMDARKVLIYGYGNPGRQDDGLGIAYVDAIEEWARKEGLAHLRFDSNYQLNIEDADNIAGLDYVLFVDASKENISDVKLTDVVPSCKVEFTMHAVSPNFVVDLCQQIYQEAPKAYLLHIKGYEWTLQEGLTSMAERNLKKAVDLTKPYLVNPIKFDDYIENEAIT